MAWKKISSKTLITHPRITLIEDTVELPNGLQTLYLTHAATHDAAEVLCIKDGQILLQKEYSYPPNEILYQLPGGQVETTETAEEGAVRELAEEAGLKPRNIRQLGWFYMNNRRSKAKMYVFLTTDVEAIEQPVGDPEEVITSHWTPISEVNAMIRQGEIVNQTLLAAWSMYKASLE